MLPWVAASSPAQDVLPPPEQYTVRVEYLWWAPTPEGELQKGLGEREGTLLDIQEDLAIESGNGHTLRGAFRLGQAWKLRLGWSPLDYKGDTQAPRPFSYGTLFARFGDRVISSFKGNQFNVDIEWDFLRDESGFLGGLVGVRYLDIDTLVLNVDTENRVAETHRLPIPVLGLAGRLYLGRWVSVEGEFAGITLGSRGHLWDWMLSARVHATDRLAVTGGYRSLSVEGEDERDYLNLKLATWTFGVEISL